jgi:GTP pyrophosphokinase
MRPPCTKEQEILKEIDSLNLSCKEISNAIGLARKVHGKQKRDGDQPYLTQHIFPIVKAILKSYRTSPLLKDLIIIALLHDTMEDSNITQKQLSQKFGKKIAQCVQNLTKEIEVKEQTNPKIRQKQKFAITREYVKKLSTKGKEEIIVKLEDRLNNLKSIVTTKQINKRYEKYKRYIAETEEIYIPLAKNATDTTINYVRLYKSEIKRIKNS